jgi:mycofactocin precursor
MKTKAAVLYEPHSNFVIEELDLAEPSFGEILVEVKASGICRTDEHIIERSMQNPLPAVLGCLYGSSVPKVEVPKFVSMFMHKKINLDLVCTKTFKLEEMKIEEMAIGGICGVY